MSDLVQTALRLLLQPTAGRDALPPMPTFRGGRELVDVADREALYRVMDAD